MIDSLSFQNITIGFSGQNPILEKTNFDFPLNQTVILQALNGGGKSSILKVLANLLRPLEGQYCVNGRNIIGLSFEDLSVYRRTIGYSFDGGGLLANKNVFENLILPLTYHRMLSDEDAVSKVQEYCDRFYLNEIRELLPSQISGGEKRICVLIRALLLEPELLLLDEPTSGVHDQIKKILIETIKLHQKSKGLKHIFIASEDRSFFEQFRFTTLRVSDRKIWKEDSL